MHALIAVTYTGEKQQQQQPTKGEKQACRRLKVLLDSNLAALIITAISRWLFTQAAIAAKSRQEWSSLRALIAGIQKGSSLMRS